MSTMKEAAEELQAALHVVEHFDDRRDIPAGDRRIFELAATLAGYTLRLSRMLSTPEWGVGMLEDIATIVGVDDNPKEESRWIRH